MKYNKRPLSFEQQADLLIERGLVADRALLIDRLKSVNYYRFSGYLYPFRESDSGNFKSGTTFDEVWHIYTFDRRLRLIVLDAVERVEVSFKTSLIYAFAHETGPFGYTDPKNFQKATDEKHEELMGKISTTVEKTREEFVKHFRSKYRDPDLPIWMIGEIISFGDALTFYRLSDNKIQQKIALCYGVQDRVFSSWLHTINYTRNICAHHSRLWNRTIRVPPRIPYKKNAPEWHYPVAIPGGKTFGILTILKYLVDRIAPQSEWKVRLFRLFDEYPEIQIGNMGFPANWRESPLWR